MEPDPVPRRAPGIDHLGILVVYYLKDDEDLPLLQLHLQRVARHTHVPYTLYGVANRVSATARDLLGTQPHVRLVDVPETDLRGNREHAHYLDALVPHALADAVSHLCTLDIDSFPIGDDWLDLLAGAAPESSGVAGILRAENGDVALPHPSCTLARRDFFEQHMPSFTPDSDGTPEFRRFLRSTGQAADTGIRLGYTLWSAGLPWGHLLRTNAVNPHYLMAGIYGDSVFHMGSVGRGKLFRRDLEASRVHRLTSPLERLPARGRTMTRLKTKLLRQLRDESEDRFAAQNRAIYEMLRDWLFSDPDGFLGYLRGTASAGDIERRTARLPASGGTDGRSGP